MYRYKLIYSLLAALLFALGFFFSFWPLSLAGLLFAAATGRYLTTVVLGLALDILYGTPVGRLSWLPAPFTLLSFVACALRYYFGAYFLRRDSGVL